MGIVGCKQCVAAHKLLLAIARYSELSMLNRVWTQVILEKARLSCRTTWILVHNLTIRSHQTKRRPNFMTIRESLCQIFWHHRR